jgi:hypothetical protein
MQESLLVQEQKQREAAENARSLAEQEKSRQEVIVDPLIFHVFYPVKTEPIRSSVMLQWESPAEVAADLHALAAWLLPLDRFFLIP